MQQYTAHALKITFIVESVVGKTQLQGNRVRANSINE